MVSLISLDGKTQTKMSSFEAGVLHANNKDHTLAIKFFSSAIVENPNNFKAYKLRGSSKRSLFDYKGAISDYSRAIVLNPKDTSAYLLRGVLKSNLEDYRGAIVDFTKLLN
ncbi:MAG: hypothetical protein IPN36_16455 [Bacteroidetes bacterium]|nr:hypothetical protein [Bacteroidota bacterium]